MYPSSLQPKKLFKGISLHFTQYIVFCEVLTSQTFCLCILLKSARRVSSRVRDRPLFA